MASAFAFLCSCSSFFLLILFSPSLLIMPAIIKIRVLSAADLPVMDRKSKLADPFVTIRFADKPKCETTIAKKTLNPLWNEEFRIEVANDLQLQDEPIVFQ